MKDDLLTILGAVLAEFVNAPAWTDPKVEVRTGFKRVQSKPVPTEARKSLPADPFSAAFTLPVGMAGPDAHASYYQPAGRSLALHARTYGAKRADEVTLSITYGPTDDKYRTLIVTATPKPENAEK